MQFVNVSSRSVYTSYAGMLAPGAVSSGKEKKCHDLEDALTGVIRECKGVMGIRLSKTEADLLDKLIKLDELGSGFKPESIPDEIRKDPTGAVRASKSRNEAQQKAMDNLAQTNKRSAIREAEINGEIAERRPVGPATLEGEPVQPSMIKSGFERIMEENARIAAGKKKDPVTDAEILDPIGYHAKGVDHGDSHAEDVLTPPDEPEAPDAPDAPADEQPEKAIGKDPEKVKEAKNVEGDVTKLADAEMPPPGKPARQNQMDKLAADTAAKLATLGPVDNKPSKPADAKAPAKSRGRGRSAK